MSLDKNKHQILPVLPLRDQVVFPHAITPLFISQPRSLAALNSALESNRKILLLAQKNENEYPGPDDMYRVGCIAEAIQVLRMPDGTAKVLVEGHGVGRLVDFFNEDAHLRGYVLGLTFSVHNPDKIEALRRTVLRLFETYAGFSDKIPEDLVRSIRATPEPLALAEAIGHCASFSVAEKQQVLEAETVDEKLLQLSRILTRENELLELESKILTQVRDQISKSQKEYFLNEQLKIIENELGMGSDEEAELDELHEAIDNSKMGDEAREKAMRELHRLSKMAPMSPEATVSRTYVEWLLDLPWGVLTRDKLDLKRAQKILDEDHYGLTKIKERVVEHLAVLRLVKDLKGPILCLVGPPGVGKTSLARSIARAMGRKFVRMSLGGVRDEAEIRGHRRTYIGSLPGKIIQGMKKAAAQNPVFLLDEIDKMGSDFRGDPASALLEVLDPEQNKSFADHYLEVDYDLSKVMFITTANTTAGIPPALLDRMEIMRLPGYTDLEKERIARQFLVPKQMTAHGLTAAMVDFTEEATSVLIDSYTREAGVRQLEREIAALCRKVAREIAARRQVKTIKIDATKVRALLGPPRFHLQQAEACPEVGVATGLAWTEVGGELLPVETTIMPGKGNLMLTGKLGEVMQESAKAALSVIRSRCERFSLPEDFQNKYDIHVHIPEGAVPKDGPSAGVALVSSMLSALSGRPVAQDVAMTGEITLRGKVLKIGGLKEKILAAHRAKIARVIMPEENRDDLEDIPEEARESIQFILVDNMDAALEAALNTSCPPKPPAVRKGGSRRVSQRTPSHPPTP